MLSLCSVVMLSLCSVVMFSLLTVLSFDVLSLFVVYVFYVLFDTCVIKTCCLDRSACIFLLPLSKPQNSSSYIVNRGSLLIIDASLFGNAMISVGFVIVY